MKSDLNLDLVSANDIMLDDKMAEFRQDPEKMRIAEEFVDGIIQQAKIAATSKLREKEKAQMAAAEADLGLKRRIGTRARRATGFIVRLFEAICNCTQQGAAAARQAATPSKK